MNETEYSMTEAALHLSITLGRYTIGRNVLMEHLRELKVLQTEGVKNQPYKEFFQANYFDVKRVEKNGRYWNKTIITEKGIKWLRANYISTIKQNEYKYWEEWYSDDLKMLTE